MGRHKIITPTNIVTIITNDGIAPTLPHTIIKEYVAKRINSDSFDEVFDAIWNIGLTHGTEEYDKAMSMAFKSLQIPEEEILLMLKARGIIA